MMEEKEIIESGLYKILKKDVHTFLMKKSGNVDDYVAKEYPYKNITFLKYKSLMTYTDFTKVNRYEWLQMVERLIKRDIKGWNGDNIITDVAFGYDPITGYAVLTLVHDK